ncbi:MAG: acyl-CoA dehydrogenase protein [Caulobacter sp.]|nr:acyl-CoA dehydrogenase protein [Caulobacter sp.]
MDFSLGKEVEDFRLVVQDFLKPWIVETDGVEGFAGKAVEPDLQRGMGDHGWLSLESEMSMDWNMKMFVFGDEASRRGFHLSSVATTMMVGFTLSQVANEEQKARWLPGINAGQIRIALGYSEPQGGSDVAGARVRSSFDGEAWAINGQKQWTTSAQHADYIWLLTRSQPESRRHGGLTVFMVPTSTPGITVTPIYTMAGERTNAVFFDNVRVPDENRVGEVDQGWKVLMAALTYEHGGGNVPGRSLTGWISRILDHGANFARARGDEVADDPWVTEKLGEIAIDAELAKLFVYRTSWAGAHIEKADVLGAMAKLHARESLVRASDKMLQMAGLAGVANAGCGDLGPDQGVASALQFEYIDAPTGTVVGGSVEIQKSIIAERGLGLPKTRNQGPRKPEPAQATLERQAG